MLLIWFVTAIRSGTCTVSRAVTPPESNQMILPSEQRHVQHETLVWWVPKEAANIFSLSLINQHIEIKIGSVKPYSLQLTQATVGMDRWSQNSIDEELQAQRDKRAKQGAAWLNLAQAQLPEGYLVPEQHFAESPCLPGSPVWVIDPWVWRMIRYKTLSSGV